MKYQSVLVSVMVFAGCKDLRSNSGDVEVDFISDTTNHLIDDKWDNEEQEMKYSSLVNYSHEECQSKMKEASKRLMDNPKAQRYLSKETKELFVINKTYPQPLYEVVAERMARDYCYKLAVLEKSSQSSR